jgi:hypothetical protein
MNNAHSGIGLALICALALSAAGSAAAETRKNPPPKTAKPASARVMAAPGQQDYTCGYSAINGCPTFEVQIWLIPSQAPPGGVAGGPAGCVAAFPYKSLILPATKPAVDTFNLVWKLPTPKVAGVTYAFTGAGIEVKPLDENLFGKVSNLFASSSMSPTQVTWTVRTDQYYDKFLGNHQPVVSYTDSTGTYACVPVDPIITNNAN